MTRDPSSSSVATSESCFDIDGVSFPQDPHCLECRDPSKQFASHVTEYDMAATEIWLHAFRYTFPAGVIPVDDGLTGTGGPVVGGPAHGERCSFHSESHRLVMIGVDPKETGRQAKRRRGERIRNIETTPIPVVYQVKLPTWVPDDVRPDIPKATSKSTK